MALEVRTEMTLDDVTGKEVVDPGKSRDGCITEMTDESRW